MKTTNRFSRRCVAGALGAISLVGAHPALAQTWDGGGADNNWTTALNWGGTAPVAGNSLTFDGGTRLTNVNDFAAGTNFGGITYAAGAGLFVTTGSSINLSGNIVSNAAVAQTLSTPLVLQNNVSGTVSGAGVLNLNGIISGGFKLTKDGTGILATSAAHTFTGGLDVLGGIFRTTVSGSTTNSLGTGTVTLGNSATLELRSTTATTFNSALNLGAGGGNIDIRSNHTFSPSSISGTGPLTLRPTGADNLVFTTTNLQSWNGQINLDRNGRTNFGLRLGTNFVNNSAINTAIELRDNTSIAKQNNTNQTTTIDIGALSSSVTTSTVGFTGTGTGTGTWNYSVGALNTSTSYAGRFVDGGTRTGLTKVGTGTLTLSNGLSTYTGGTAINGGTLAVTNATGSATGTGAVTVNSGGTLAGTGIIGGAVTANSGGTIAPGLSPGILTVNNNVALTTGANLAIELNGTTVGTGYDQLAVNGTVDLGGANLLLSLGYAPASTDFFYLVNNDGTDAITNTLAGLPEGSEVLATFGGDTYKGTISYLGDVATNGLTGGNDLVLFGLAIAVPEPGSIGFLLLGGVGMIPLVRRRRK